MNFSKIMSGVIILCTFTGCSNKVQVVDEQFNGMWKLEKIESIDKESGNWTYDPAFNGWNGYILYDGHGHMGVQITPNGYRDFDVDKNIDNINNEDLKELVKFYQSNWVYFANYKITNQTIDHKRLSATNPKDWGSVLTRDFEFRKDTLILTAHEIVGGKKSRLLWIKCLR
jgi:hypothetical protein